MCRLFGLISIDPVRSEMIFSEGPHSLAVQSTIDPKRRQVDGWGIGWFERGRPQVKKSPNAIYRERSKATEAAREAKGSTYVGHIRWASNPLKLSKRELIGTVHTQPFTHGRWIFAHNGTLYIPREVRRALGPWSRFVRGHNDSEVLFYWLLKHLRLSSIDTLTSSLQNALNGLDAIWKTCRKRYPLFKYPYHGLNWVLTDGKVLAAACWVNAGGLGKTKALGRTSQPYYQLLYRTDGRTLCVASQPMDAAPGWQTLPYGECLLAQKTGRRLVVRRKLTCPSKNR